jgi:hypothetical protein
VDSSVNLDQSVKKLVKSNFKFEPKDFTSHSKIPLELISASFGEE